MVRLCQFFIKGPGGVVAFAMCCLVIYTVLPASHLPVGNKAVLITGSLFLFSSSSIKVQNDYCHYYGTDTYLVIKNIYLRIRVCMINNMKKTMVFIDYTSIICLWTRKNAYNY
jgi:hypothetical protein